MWSEGMEGRVRRAVPMYKSMRGALPPHKIIEGAMAAPPVPFSAVVVSGYTRLVQ